jgi:hypothetical protein
LREAAASAWENSRAAMVLYCTHDFDRKNRKQTWRRGIGPAGT